MYDRYRFPYRLLRGRPSPLVLVHLFHNRNRTTAYAYVDSGAYYSIFLPRVADRLGIAITTGERRRVTLANGQVITVYLHRMGFRLGREHFTATIGFSEGLGVGFNLLGRYSIFDKPLFCFNDHEHMLYVSRIEQRDES